MVNVFPFNRYKDIYLYMYIFVPIKWNEINHKVSVEATMMSDLTNIHMYIHTYIYMSVLIY
jgi:hypothetical protein